MKNNKSVKFIWTISFICIWLIPMIFGLITYVNYDRVLSSNIDKTNSGVLYNKSMLIDDIVKRASDLASGISANPSLLDLAGFSLPYTPDEQYDIHQFINEWFKYYTGDTSINNTLSVYVYLPKSDAIISNNLMTTRRFFDANYQGDSNDYTKWIETISKEDSYEFSHFEIASKNKKSVLYILKSAEHILYENAPSVVVDIDAQVLSNLGMDSKYTKLYVLDNYNNLILGDNDEMLQKIVTGENFKNQSDYIINTIHSRDTRITYVFSQSKKSYRMSLDSVRNISYLLFAVCIIISLVIAKRLIKYNSRPINKILGMFSQDKKNKYDNEYKYIGEQILNILDERNQRENMLSSQKEYLRNDVLVKALNGNVINKTILNSFDIQFDGGYFEILLLSITKTDELFFEKSNNSDSIKLALYAIENVVNEMLLNKCSHYVFVSNGIVHCILCYKDSPDNFEQGIYAILREANSFLKSNLNFEFVCATSSVGKSIELLPELYSEVKEVLEYKYIYYEKKLLTPDILKTNKEYSYNYSIQKEQNAINCIRTGNYTDAISMLNDVLGIDNHDMKISLPIVKCLVYDVLCTVIKAYNEVMPPNIENEDKMSMYSRIVDCQNISEVKLQIDNVIREIQERYDGKAKTNINVFVVEKAQRLVDEKYGNENLTIQQLSEYLNISPNYLSSMFKQQYGISLFEYISKVRIDKSKELLKSTNSPISLIAKQVGFTTERTFIRTFSKLEGITPGRYRNI